MKKSKKILLALLFTFFYFCSLGYSIEKKEALVEYFNKINPVLIKVQIASRNLSQKLLPLEGIIQEMQNSIDTIKLLVPPEFLVRQHKMILLSFKKLKMGFYLLSKGDKEVSIRLVKRGRNLLRNAAKDIVEFSKKEGLIKKDTTETIK